MTCNACTLAGELWSILNALQGYVIYNNYRKIFEFIGNLEQRCVPQLQRACYAVGDLVVALEDAAPREVTPEAFGRNAAVGGVSRYLASSFAQ